MELTALAVYLNDHCTKNTCPQMKATDEWMYLCAGNTQAYASMYVFLYVYGWYVHAYMQLHSMDVFCVQTTKEYVYICPNKNVSTYACPHITLSVFVVRSYTCVYTSDMHKHVQM